MFVESGSGNANFEVEGFDPPKDSVPKGIRPRLWSPWTAVDRRSGSVVIHSALTNEKQSAVSIPSFGPKLRGSALAAKHFWTLTDDEILHVRRKAAP